jgi:phosphoribosylanthranilate isomerase
MIDSAPMPTRIKICCLASAQEARMAIDAGADAIGFNGVPGSPRRLDDAAIAGILADLPASIETVLLSVERTAAAISAHIRRTRTASVQIIDHIDPAELARLAALEPDVRRIQVIHVEGCEALDRIPAYAPHAHAFLLDSGKPNAATPEYGGTGRTHDWAVSAAFVQASPLPVFLAGGLSPANVKAAIARVRPFDVDLCSGVRTEGRLDAAKLAAFIAAVRRADEPGLRDA